MTQSSVWSDSTGFDIPDDLRARIRASLLDACDWCVRNQVCDAWPDWDANTGRLPFNVDPDTGKSHLSIVWAIARAAQGMLSAMKAAGDNDLARIETAERALFWATTLQLYSPEFPELNGAIVEETPLCRQINPRDGMECSMGWLTKHWFDGPAADRLWMLRARDHLQWTVNYLMQRPEWPLEYLFFGHSFSDETNRVPRRYGCADIRVRKPNSDLSFYNGALLLPVCQYSKWTGDESMLNASIGDMAEWVAGFIDADTGAFRHTGDALGHHGDTINGLSNVLSNDDGVVIALLAYLQLRPDNDLLAVALKNCDWWLTVDKFGELFAPLSSSILLMLDAARLTGRKDYLDWSLKMTGRLLKTQDLSGDPKRNGAFMGAERSGPKSHQMPCLRVTSYAMIALSKLLATAETWSPSYSAFY